ncbi:MAG: dihydroorotate dehydrogenase [Lentimicrobium sp.]
MANLTTQIHRLKLQNPVMTASGTFGYGEEFADFVDLNRLGAIIVKGTTSTEREGNPYPRMAETASGMLNSVGLQNKGIDYFIHDIWPRLKKYKIPFIVNVSGSTIEEYVETAEKLNSIEELPAIELNISCPNVKEGGMAFGTSSTAAAKVTKSVRDIYHKTLIVKLSPNVTDITEIARAVEGAGADAVSLINTLLGMAIDANSRKPVLSTITGGLSGPAIKPIALRMVWQVFQAIKIPVIGIGGIMNATDAIEFLLAGASAIEVGTANFIDPTITSKIIDGINDYCERNHFTSVKDLVGALIIPEQTVDMNIS